MFRIWMLPAREGDCLWIEYGDADRPHRILIDGGKGATHKEVRRRLEALDPADRRLELAVVTHVDADHIEGLLSLLEKPVDGTTYGDIWFNGWRHMPGSDYQSFGPVQGERLTKLLLDEELPWNRLFQGGAVRLPDDETLPGFRLPGGMQLTLLSPGIEELRALEPVWVKKCAENGLDPAAVEPGDPVPPGYQPMGPIDVEQLAATDTDPDDSEANGASIALLAEYEGHSVLLAGDAHAPVLRRSLDLLAADGERLAMTALKLPHHASQSNVRAELLERVDAAWHLVSSNGARHHHPDRVAIARVLIHETGPKKILFNYRTKYTRIWDDPDLVGEYDGEVYLPDDGEEGIGLDLVTGDVLR